MRPLLLLLILLVSGSSVFAQSAPRPTTTDSVAFAAVPDTVAAIHRLFADKRTRNSRFAAATLGVTALGGVVVGTAPSGWNGLGQAVLGIAIITFVSLPAFTVEAITALDYNKKSEQRAVEDFQAHKVPNYLKRKLKPWYFRQMSLTSSK